LVSAGEGKIIKFLVLGLVSPGRIG